MENIMPKGQALLEERKLEAMVAQGWASVEHMRAQNEKLAHDARLDAWRIGVAIVAALGGWAAAIVGILALADKL